MKEKQSRPETRVTLRYVYNTHEERKAYEALRDYYRQLHVAVFNLGCFISQHEAAELRPIEQALQAQQSALFKYVSFLYDEEQQHAAERDARNKSNWTGD